MDAPRTKTSILVAALDILARDIESGDGVANAAIAEGARRIEELEAEANKLSSQRLTLRLTMIQCAEALNAAALSPAE